ncbi:MAG: zf-HC2 domain-containing protein [Acidobacteria bacterium]|nr:zf-HC2 domain-containing protein [Acidobacteriota bacterium]
MNHHEILEMLPWYANASLDEPTRRSVEAHLRECAECARELEEIEKLERSMKEFAAPVPEPSPFLLTRAKAAIEDYERGRWWPAIPSFARAVMAAQLVLIVALAGGVVYLKQPGGGFTTLSGPTGQAGAGPRLTVAFQAGVSEELARQTILELRGTIVGGPSALGLYTIQLPDGAGLGAALARLRENQRVIRFAQKAAD